MKAREPRTNVVIRARMRTDAMWGEVCLLNLSSRGVLAQAPVPPPRGAYIEFQRGAHVIVARVVWAEKHRFGVWAQDVIAVNDIIVDPGHPEGKRRADHAVSERDQRTTERGRSPGERHEQSRLVGRSMEFCFLVALAVMLAGTAFTLVQQGIAAPMQRVSATLAM